MITTTKTTGLTLGMLAIGGLLTTSAQTATRPTTTTTAAFADSNSLSRLEHLQPLWGSSLYRRAVPPHRYKDRTD